MKDPFFKSPIAALEDWVRPYAEQYHMTVFPQHAHEVIAAALLYTFVHLVISPWLSNKYAAAYYPTDKGKRASWDSHVVSLFQSTLICIVALYVMWTDNERASMDWQGRIWGYTGASGLVQSLAAGYFIWDFCITISNLKVFGFGLLAHAVSALSVYSLGYVSAILRFSPTRRIPTDHSAVETLLELLRLRVHSVRVVDPVP